MFRWKCPRNICYKYSIVFDAVFMERTVTDLGTGTYFNPKIYPHWPHNLHSQISSLSSLDRNKWTQGLLSLGPTYNKPSSLSWIRPSRFHSKLNSYLFLKSFPPGSIVCCVPTSLHGFLFLLIIYGNFVNFGRAVDYSFWPHVKTALRSYLISSTTPLHLFISFSGPRSTDIASLS